MDNVTMERLKAVITLVVTCAVNVANVYGYAVDAEQWVNVALSVLSAACIAWTWWKNMNITQAAIKAQGYLDELKGKHLKED